MALKVPVPAAIAGAIAAASIYVGDAEPTQKPVTFEDEIKQVFPVTDENQVNIDDNFVLNLPGNKGSEITDTVVTEETEAPGSDGKQVAAVRDKDCGFKDRVKRTDPTPDYLVNRWNTLFDGSPPPVRDAMGGKLARNTQLGALENGVKNMANHISGYSKKVAELDSILRQGTGITSGGKEGLNARKQRLKQLRGS